MNRTKVTFLVMLILLIVLGAAALLIGLKVQEQQKPPIQKVYTGECLPGPIASAPKCYESQDWKCSNSCPWPQSAYCFYEGGGQGSGYGQCGCALPNCTQGISSWCLSNPTCRANYVCTGSTTDPAQGWTWSGSLVACTDPTHINWTVCANKTDAGCVLDHKVSGTCTTCGNGSEIEIYCKAPAVEQGYKCDTTTKVCPVTTNCNMDDTGCYADKATCDTNAPTDCPATVVQGYKCDTTTKTCPAASNCTVGAGDSKCYAEKATCDTNAPTDCPAVIVQGYKCNTTTRTCPATTNCALEDTGCYATKAECDTNLNTDCPATITRYRCTDRNPDTCDLSANTCSTTNTNDVTCNAANFPFVTTASCKLDASCNILPATGLEGNGLNIMQIIFGLFILGFGISLFNKVNYRVDVNRKSKFEEKVLRSLD